MVSRTDRSSIELSGATNNEKQSGAKKYTEMRVQPPQTQMHTTDVLRRIDIINMHNNTEDVRGSKARRGS